MTEKMEKRERRNHPLSKKDLFPLRSPLLRETSPTHQHPQCKPAQGFRTGKLRHTQQSRHHERALDPTSLPRGGISWGEIEMDLPIKKTCVGV